jgi:hypothetical protein
MRLVVITPVGPGHSAFAADAIESVHVARNNISAFSDVRHIVIDDSKGELGRSRARNLGMIDDADWYFFLDADDRMRPDALDIRNFETQAIFGAISLASHHKRAKDVYPCGWREISLHGASGTLSMGFFCRADIAKRLRFNEALDAGEDFEFYLRLDDFAKIDRPLVDIGYSLPSAGGPRGYDEIDWIGLCNTLVIEAVAREPNKYDLRGNAVLAKTSDPV